MNLPSVIAEIIAPTFADVLPSRFTSPEASVMLLAIGLQESRFEHRRQIGGPAMGFWQFERGGGVAGVLSHPASSKYARAVCAIRDRAVHDADVYDGLDDDDLLACAFARLLLFTDPAPLPRVGDWKAAWDYYLRNWRPGKPHPETWRELYDRAARAVAGAA